MTNRERENATLAFRKNKSRGSIQETFYPWNLTIDNFVNEGLPKQFSFTQQIPNVNNHLNRYHYTLMALSNHSDYENFLGLDCIKRLALFPPFKCFDEKIIEENDAYILMQDQDGWVRKYFKHNNMIQDIQAIVTDLKTWQNLKQKMLIELDQFFTDEIIKQVYTPLRPGHKKGDYSIRFRILGFFWVARELFGVEKHLLAFYDSPELLHEINEFLLGLYLKYLDKIFDIIPADVLLICEDLSGSNGPMLSPSLFDEFISAYYKRLIPLLKSKGVKSVLIDTDGDFTQLIPNFIEAGVDGFLPMDVNAGMDIIKTRKVYPNLQFIGGFNKLEISKGEEAIDQEFLRLMPIIRQGGYIPGADHQIAPDTSLINYKYYISKLKIAMLESGSDL